MSAMLAASSASRRKVTTYGKPSSRRVDGYARENEPPLSSTYGITKPGERSDDRIIERVTRPPKTSTTVVDDGSIANVRQGDLAQRSPVSGPPPGSTESGTMVASSKLPERGTTASRETPSSHHVRGTIPCRTDGSDDELGVFDVPSSDENDPMDVVAREVRTRPRPKTYHSRQPAISVSRSGGSHKLKLGGPISSSTNAIHLKRNDSWTTTGRGATPPLSDHHAVQRQIGAQFPSQHGLRKPGGPPDSKGKQLKRKKTSTIPRRSLKVNPAKLNRPSVGNRADRSRGERAVASGSGDADSGNKRKTVGFTVTIERRPPVRRGSFVHPRSSMSTISISNSEENAKGGRGSRETTQASPPMRTPSPRKYSTIDGDTASSPEHSRMDLSPSPPPPAEFAGVALCHCRHTGPWDQLLEGGRSETGSIKPSFEESTIDRLRNTSPPHLNAAALPTLKTVPVNKRAKIIDALARESSRAEEADINMDPSSDDGQAVTGLDRDQTIPRTDPSPAVIHPVGPIDLPSGQSQTPPLETMIDSRSSSDQSVAPVPAAGLKVTYARQRSYLTESSVAEAALPNIALEAGNSADRLRRRRNRPKVATIPSMPSDLLPTDDEDDVDHVNDGSIRTIHELRAAGGHKRFLDEFEGLIEDITDTRASAGPKSRAGLLELATKLFKSSNARRFLDLQLERRLLSGMGVGRDVVSNFSMACIVAVLGREGLDRRVVSRTGQGALSMLTDLLAVDRDIIAIAQDRDLKMTKASRMSVSELADALLRSHLWPIPPKFASPRIVTLLALEGLSTTGGGEDDEVNKALPSRAAGAIISILAQTFDWSHDRPLPAQTAVEIEMSLSFLEACTAANAGFDLGGVAEETAWVQVIVEMLLYVGRDGAGHGKRIQASVLRLFLNLTNGGNAVVDRSVGTVEVAEALTRVISSGFGDREGLLDPDEGSSSVDELILGLAAMINLVESSSDMRLHTMRPNVDGLPLLDALMTPFLHGLRRTNEVRDPRPTIDG